MTMIHDEPLNPEPCSCGLEPGFTIIEVPCGCGDPACAVRKDSENAVHYGNKHWRLWCLLGFLARSLSDYNIVVNDTSSPSPLASLGDIIKERRTS